MATLCWALLLLTGAPAAAQMVEPRDFTPEQVSAGQALYDRNCSPCHGSSMADPEGAFDLRKFPHDQHERFVESIIHGKNTMPPWGSLLKSEEIEALWAYVVSGAPNAPAVAPAMAGVPPNAPPAQSGSTTIGARAQLAAPNDAGVSMGHLHFNVQDVDAAKKFWIAFGGTSASKLGANEVVKFPGVLVLIRKVDPSGGTVGSVVNHIGFFVPNVQAAVPKWKAAGLHVEPGNNGNLQQAYVITPDDLVRIEILENASQSVPLSFHHVHFYVAEPGTRGASSVSEIQAWYAKTFGAKPGKRGQFEAADVPGANLTFTKSDTPTVPTKGRALDHIGFEIKGLEAFCKKLEANGVKLDMPFTNRPDLGISLAFITDPWGTYIELNEGLNRL